MPMTEEERQRLLREGFVPEGTSGAMTEAEKERLLREGFVPEDAPGGGPARDRYRTGAASEAWDKFSKFVEEKELPGLELIPEVVDTGGALLERFADIGVKTAADPIFKLPSIRQIKEKTGETYESFKGFLPALASIPGELRKREGRKKLALGALETINVKDRFEQGDLAGLVADALLTKGGLGAARGGLKALKTAAKDKLGKTAQGAKVAEAAEMAAFQAEGLINKATGLPMVFIRGLKDWVNTSAGVPPRMKRQALEAMDDPRQNALMEKAAAQVDPSVKPFVIAEVAREKIRKLVTDMNDEFGAGLAGIDLTEVVVGSNEVLRAMLQDLKKMGVGIEEIIAPVKTPALLDAFGKPLPLTGQREVTGLKGDPQEYSRHVAGDKLAMDIVLEEVHGIKNGTLGEYRSALTMISDKMKDRDYLNSGKGDKVLAQATSRLREAITEAAEVHGLPQAQALKALNSSHVVKLRNIEEMLDTFTITQNIKSQAMMKKMLSAYEDKFARNYNMRLLEEMDPNREIIPVLLGYKASETFDASTMSRYLGGAQMTGITFGWIAGALGIGMGLGAIGGVSLALASSPKLILATTKFMTKAQRHQYTTAMKVLVKKTKERLHAAGGERYPHSKMDKMLAAVTVGAAFDRLRSRGEDVLAQQSRDDDVLTQLGTLPPSINAQFRSPRVQQFER
jgi:hypothetical protein